MALLSYSDDNALNDPTYNWPYDYFSLVELDKLTTKTGFRPDLAKENAELDRVQQARIDPSRRTETPPGGAVDVENVEANAAALQNLINNQNSGNT